jgi:hypothetical protein
MGGALMVRCWLQVLLQRVQNCNQSCKTMAILLQPVNVGGSQHDRATPRTCGCPRGGGSALLAPAPGTAAKSCTNQQKNTKTPGTLIVTLLNCGPRGVGCRSQLLVLLPETAHTGTNTRQQAHSSATAHLWGPRGEGSALQGPAPGTAARNAQTGTKRTHQHNVSSHLWVPCFVGSAQQGPAAGTAAKSCTHWHKHETTGTLLGDCSPVGASW